MIQDLSPRRQFQSSAENLRTFTEIVGQPVFRAAMTYAMGELIMSAVTTQELDGAKKFALLLYTLADLPEQQRMPEKGLATMGGDPPQKL